MLTLRDLLISPKETLRSAMQRMTRNRKGILLVCDSENHLVGVLSDGDVRRVLSDDSLLLSGIDQAMNLDPITARTTDEGIDVARRRRLVAVPILDEEGRIKEAVVEEAGDVRILPAIHRVEVPGASLQSLQALAIIPARGGSKRLPKKNLAMVLGKPLIEWAIRAGRLAGHVGEVLVSTDDQDIADIARRAGASVPWLRPTDLAKDDTPTLDVVLHALDWATQSLRPLPEFGVLLEPTAPLRLARHLDQALEMLQEGDADSVVSVSEVPHLLNPEELMVIHEGSLRAFIPSRTLDSRLLRGRHKPAYVPNGLVYAFRISSVLQQRSLFGRKTLPLVTEWTSFLDIDVTADLEIANLRMGHLQAKKEL